MIELAVCTVVELDSVSVVDVVVGVVVVVVVVDD